MRTDRAEGGGGDAARSRAAARLAIAAAGLAVLLLAASRIWLIPAHISFNPNEGWNAFQSAAALGAGPLYPDPHALTANNYPPLSFYVVGWAGRLVGDAIVAGRLVSLAALLAVAAGVHQAVARFAGEDRTLPAVGALLLLGFVATQYRAYLAMDDPQWLAHAGMTWAVVLLLPGTAEAPPRAGRVTAAAALMLLSGLVKHNLVVFPLAATVWLALHYRRALGLWVVTAAAGLLLAAAVCRWMYGPDVFADILTAPRHTSWLRMWRSSLLPLASAVPLAAVSLGLLRMRRTDPRCDLVLLAIGLGVALGVLQRSGQGVNVNAHFEGLIALCVGAQAALAALSERDGRAQVSAAALLIAPFVVLVPLTLRTEVREVSGLRPAQAAWTAMRERIARTPGAVACETPALCYWAGKPYALDVFMYGQRAAAAGNADELSRALAQGRLAAVERDPPRLTVKAGDVANPILPLLDRAGAPVFVAADGRRLLKVAGR